MTMLQINPPLPVVNLSGDKGFAHFLIDYGVEHDLVFVVALDDSREIWCYKNKDIRIQENITFGREKETFDKRVKALDEFNKREVDRMHREGIDQEKERLTRLAREAKKTLDEIPH